MYYYPTRADCPGKAELARMTLEQAAYWVAKACTHECETSRLAQMKTWFGLTHAEAYEAHQRGVAAVIADWPKRA